MLWQAYSYEYLGSKNQLKLKAEQDCEILMQKKYFSEYSGYRIPKLKEIILIREAYKASSLFKKTIRESNSANNSNAEVSTWFYLPNENQENNNLNFLPKFIKPFSSTSEFNEFVVDQGKSYYGQYLKSEGKLRLISAF